MGQSATHSLSRKTSEKFSEEELEMLNKLFKDLAKRSPGRTMDRATFYQLFPMPGMHAESLFDLFDQDRNGVIDYKEFMTGLAVFMKGSLDEKIEAIFKIYDIDKTNYVSTDELKTMLLHIPLQTLKAVDKYQSDASRDGGDRIELVDRLVNDAFEQYDTNKDSKLSKEQFYNWVKNTPSIVGFLDEYSLSHDLDNIDNSTKSGILFKSGKFMKGKCFKRFYVLRSNILYYYHLTDIDRPAGVVFLQGCFIKSLESKSPRNGSNLGSPTAKGRPPVAASSPLRNTAKSPKSPRLGIRKPSSPSAQKRWDKLEEALEDEAIDLESQPGGKSILNVSQLFGFEIISEKLPKRTIYAATDQKRKEWVAALSEACDNIPFEQRYKVLEKVGVGSFGTVYKCKKIADFHEGDPSFFAVKVVEKHSLKNEKRIDELYKELAILKLVEHPNIIRLRGFFESVNTIHIVLDFAQGGDLIDQIGKLKRAWNEDECRHLMRALLDAIRYLHAYGICHRDIKPENILCSGGATILESKFMICDFGLSKLVSPQGVMTDPVGTLAYVAPEIITCTSYSKASDLWSIGVILYLVSKGHLPFQPPGTIVSQVSLSKHIAFTRLQVSKELENFKVSKELIDILSKLLDKDPNTRITASLALKHAWFNTAAVAAPANPPPAQAEDATSNQENNP